MRHHIYIILVFATACCSCSNMNDKRYKMLAQGHGTPIEERRESLGGGYADATIAESSSASWESIGHFGYLMYKGKKVCRLDDYTISPDKRFLVFKEFSETGKIFILDKKTHTKVELLSKSPGVVHKFDWKAKEGFLKIEIYDKDALFVPLPTENDWLKKGVKVTLTPIQ